ncbi:hypothetical protein [Streptomyces sp. NPDC089799]|uniref:hypothetical protein n=1 Tax=Streptomyces sp. NPDC089799 TaxID=3155066 RepID=UPI0034498278
MRSSARIPSILAGLALAVGGAVFAAPAAHADVQDCVQMVANQNVQVTDAVQKACYQGQNSPSGSGESSCDAALEKAGATRDLATQACRAAQK